MALHREQSSALKGSTMSCLGELISGATRNLIYGLVCGSFLDPRRAFRLCGTSCLNCNPRSTSYQSARTPTFACRTCRIVIISTYGNGAHTHVRNTRYSYVVVNYVARGRSWWHSRNSVERLRARLYRVCGNHKRIECHEVITSPAAVSAYIASARSLVTKLQK